MTDDDLALAFASAISEPGGRAVYIQANNKADKRVDERGQVLLGEGGKPLLHRDSLERAVLSGRPFFVDTREGILAIDGDTPEGREWAVAARTALEPRGFRFVITLSGGDDERQHIFVVSPAAWTNRDIANELSRVAGPPPDPRQVRFGQGIRPPLAPHRAGGRSIVVEPDVATALAWFQGKAPRPLSAAMVQVLRSSNTEDWAKNRDGSPSRGITIGRLAVAAVNRHWSLDQFKAELADVSNRPAQKVRDLPATQRQGAIENYWTKAWAFVHERPPEAPSEYVRRDLRRLLSDLECLGWAKRTGAYDRRVFAALLRAGIDGGTAEPRAAVRRLAADARVSVKTTARSLKRLAAMGLIETVREERPGYASTHRVLGWAAEEGMERVNSSSLLSKGARSNTVHLSPHLEDIFSSVRGGLGPTRRETWDALTDEPQTVKEVISRLPTRLSAETVRGHLLRLRDHGFAANCRRRWTRLEPSEASLGSTARTLGVRRPLAARENYATRQQEDFHKHLEKRAEFFNVPLQGLAPVRDQMAAAAGRG